jgi:hypothetical protein
VALVVALSSSAPGTARADDAGPPTYRAVIDRVALERDSIGGLRLQVELSALTQQGQLLDLSDPKSIKALVGGSKLDAPYARGYFGATSGEAVIVFVVQANLAYAEALPTILTTLDEAVLSKLADRTQVAILAYGEATEAGKLGSLKAARARIGTLVQDGSAGEPALLDTLDRAMRLLKKAKPPREGAALRKIIVVIGDGRDRGGDRDRVTKFGLRADKDGVRIHSVGFAPSNVRRPLLTLGELSKRSLGTFRWVRSAAAESWTPAFQQLRDEINKQYVLTYFLPLDAEVAGRKLKIVTVGRTEATSNELKIPEARCGRDACAGYCVDDVCATPLEASGRGVLGWLFLLLGVAAVAVVGLGAIGFVLHRRQQAAGGPGRQPPAPGQQPAPVAPPPPATGPALLVITGPRAGQRIPLQNGFTIGKAPNSSLVLDDGYTSSQHAQVGMDHTGVCRLYDRNSTNGTYVNGVRITTEVVLDHGMSVRIGSIELRFLAQ